MAPASINIAPAIMTILLLLSLPPVNIPLNLLIKPPFDLEDDPPVNFSSKTIEAVKSANNPVIVTIELAIFSSSIVEITKSAAANIPTASANFIRVSAFRFSCQPLRASPTSLKMSFIEEKILRSFTVFDIPSTNSLNFLRITNKAPADNILNISSKSKFLTAPTILSFNVPINSPIFAPILRNIPKMPEISIELLFFKALKNSKTPFAALPTNFVIPPKIADAVSAILLNVPIDLTVSSILTINSPIFPVTSRMFVPKGKTQPMAVEKPLIKALIACFAISNIANKPLNVLFKF